jgi:FMN phosphatase YigB (HAD superfamily)
MLMTTGKTIVFFDVDGCFYDRGSLGFLLDGAEKASAIKNEILNHCLAAGGGGWTTAARSYLHTIRKNPNVRAIGKSIDRIVMNVLFQCAENSKLADALSELSKNPDLTMVFLTNGPGGHARNTVRTVLTEEALKRIFGPDYSNKIILTKTLSYKKPDSRAFEDALQVTMNTMGISSKEEISKIFVVDDNRKNLEGAKEAFGDKVDCIHITQEEEDEEFLTCPNMLEAVNTIVPFCAPHQHASR